jgi:urease accessory protein
MMRAERVIPCGTWQTEQAVDIITLDYDRRYRRRIRLHTDAGAELLLDLPEATHLREGDALDCGADGLVRVVAAQEPIAAITGDPALLIRLAWHLGNRHLDVAFGEGTLLIRSDHVIETMVRGLGAQVQRLVAPFDPESGAYAHDHG